MSSKQFARFITRWWPEFGSEGTLDALLQIKDLVFFGPIALFAYLDAPLIMPRYPLPIHIQCPQHMFQTVRELLAKHLQKQQQHQTDYHFLHKQLYETYVMTNEAVVFLFDEPDIVSFVDVYNMTFNASSEFQASQQQLAHLQKKTCHLHAKLFKGLLFDLETLDRFLDFDCWMLHSMDFQMDWNSQNLWRHIWKLLIQAQHKQRTWLDLVDAWNAKVVPHYVHNHRILNRRPLLTVNTQSPFLQKDQMCIGNALYGSALLAHNNTAMLLDTSWVDSLPFLKLDTVNLASAVTTQIGECFDDTTQQKTFVLQHNQPIQLADMFQTETVRVHIPSEQKKTCHVFNKKQHGNMSRFLQANTDSIAVFAMVGNKTRRSMQASCYDWSQVSQRRMYTCDEKSAVNKRKNYWELGILDDKKHNIVISQENLDIVRRRTTRYFFVIQLRTNVTFIDADNVDTHIVDTNCEKPKPLSGIMPIVLSANTNNTPQRAIRKIFQKLSKQLDTNIKSSSSQKQQQYDDEEDTETETTYSGSDKQDDSDEDDSEQDERNILRQQRQPYD